MASCCCCCCWAEGFSIRSRAHIPWEQSSHPLGVEFTSLGGRVCIPQPHAPQVHSLHLSDSLLTPFRPTPHTTGAHSSHRQIHSSHPSGPPLTPLRSTPHAPQAHSSHPPDPLLTPLRPTPHTPQTHSAPLSPLALCRYLQLFCRYQLTKAQSSSVEHWGSAEWLPGFAPIHRPYYAGSRPYYEGRPTD